MKFLYTTSAQDLWEELLERYDESNGLLIYQIKREISSISQRGMSIAVNYTKLKQLWGEYNNIEAIPSCTCGSMKIAIEVHNSDKLIQFLKGLNDT